MTGDVTVHIPAGALAEPRHLSLERLAIDTIAVEPDTEFLLPVTVSVKNGIGNNSVPLILREWDGEYYLHAEAQQQGSGFTYETTGFTKHKFLVPRQWKGLPFSVGDVYPVLIEYVLSGGLPSLSRLSELRNNPTASLVDVRTLAPSLSGRGAVNKIRRNKGTCKSPADCAASQGICGDNSKDCPFSASGKCVKEECAFTRDENEVYLMTREAAQALAEAECRVQSEIDPADADWHVRINGSYNSTGRMHGGRSLHYTGVALDLSLCHGKCESRAVEEEALLGRLAPILVAVGFSWDWYEDSAHIHASIVNSSANPSSFRCLECGARRYWYDPAEKQCLKCGDDSAITSKGSECCPILNGTQHPGQTGGQMSTFYDAVLEDPFFMGTSAFCGSGATCQGCGTGAACIAKTSNTTCLTCANYDGTSWSRFLPAGSTCCDIYAPAVKAVGANYTGQTYCKPAEECSLDVGLEFGTFNGCCHGVDPLTNGGAGRCCSSTGNGFRSCL